MESSYPCDRNMEWSGGYTLGQVELAVYRVARINERNGGEPRGPDTDCSIEKC
jgi:hypothetical protein